MCLLTFEAESAGLVVVVGSFFFFFFKWSLVYLKIALKSLCSDRSHELSVLISLPPGCQIYRNVSACLLYVVLGMESRDFSMPGKHSTD